mgnify:CR=1 FL=1
MTPAGKLQDHLKHVVQKSGGQYRKVRWEGRSGCPDCFIWWTWPRAAFIEIKAEGDRLVEASPLDWTIVRPPAIYGPGDMEMLELFRLAKKHNVLFIADEIAHALQCGRDFLLFFIFRFCQL